MSDSEFIDKSYFLQRAIIHVAKLGVIPLNAIIKNIIRIILKTKSGIEIAILMFEKLNLKNGCEIIIASAILVVLL